MTIQKWGTNTILHKYNIYPVPPKKSTFLNNCQKLTNFNDFGMINPEKILQICPTHLSNVATLPWEIQKSHFNGIIHTYFRLFTFSQKKTNCNPLAHPTWKCHHTNLWTAKLFHLTEGLLHSFKRWSAEEKQLWVFIGGSEKNRLWCLATGKQCVQSDYLLH